MREDIMLNILVLIAALIFGVILFKVLVDFIPKDLTKRRLIKGAFALFYWFWFIVFLNIPFHVREYHVLVPFENGDYFSFESQEARGETIIQFNYLVDGVVMPKFLWVNENFDEESVSISENGEVSIALDSGRELIHFVVEEDENMAKAISYERKTVADVMELGDSSVWYIYAPKQAVNDIIAFFK